MNELNFEIDFTTLFIIISAVCSFAIQLLLCFKAKRTFIKFIPISIFIVSTIVFSICSAFINGWDGLGYLFFALLSFGMTLICGIGWGIWAIFQKQIK